MDDVSEQSDKDDVSLDESDAVDSDAVNTSEADVRDAINETIKPILDGSTYGGVKQSKNIRTWELQGLLKPGSSSKVFSAFHLSKHPPKLVFKSFNDPYTDEYAVYLDKYTAQQLADALSNVVRAYKSMPITEKREKWTIRNLKKRLRESFEDEPVKFIVKTLGIIAVMALIIVAMI